MYDLNRENIFFFLRNARQMFMLSSV